MRLLSLSNCSTLRNLIFKSREFCQSSVKITLFYLTIFILYYYVGIHWFSQYEGWNTEECIYFITVTLSTFGYGDLVPKSQASRIFSIFYNTFGIVFVVSMINSAASWMIQKMRPKDNLFHPVEHLWHFCILIFSLVLLIMIGALFFCLISDKEITFVDGFYWAVITISTVGYGDVLPTTKSQKLFAIIFILCGVAIFSATIAEVTYFREYLVEVRKEKEMLGKMLDVRWINELDMDGNGEVQKEEFILAILCKLGVIEKEKHVDRWAHRFDELDVNKDGSLTLADLELLVLTEERMEKEKMEKLNIFHTIGRHQSDRSPLLPKIRIESDTKASYIRKCFETTEK